MKQVLQSLRDGAVGLADTPVAGTGAGAFLIRTRASLLSAGTERMLLEFGKAGWLEKARQQPDQVRRVIEKIRTDGLAATIESVRAKLDQPIALGYSNAGVRVDTGARVASNGPHAEVVRVPVNLCAAIPERVSDGAAAFTVVSAIALQGVRLAAPTLGESFAVTGLGLIGLLAVQLLRAHGCRVLGIDYDARKCGLARQFGAETVDLSHGGDPVAAAEEFSRGRGLDGVLITAATKSSEPVHQAAVMCRKRGRIVLTGVTGLELSRDDFYKKELTFQVSCSYGPGRYDGAYEQGQDYPAGFVRWTAQRNFEAVLDMMAEGRLDVEPLITHRFPFERALEAYELLESKEFHLGILLEYPREGAEEGLFARTIRLKEAQAPAAGKGCVGFIGAGGYATKVLIPAFRKAGAALVSIASSGDLSAARAGRKFGFAEATTDVEMLLGNPGIDTAVIATRHDSHAALVCRALAAGKHVFVEKPLALKDEELDAIESAWAETNGRQALMVGFNRRFAPHVVKMRELLAGTAGPKTFVYTVNAGAIPKEHWTQDPESGGGRIAGEACHFLDLLRFLVGHAAADLKVTRQAADVVTITVRYEDGSMGTVHYLANGHKGFPKERLEVFCAGRILVLDNFRKLAGCGWPGFRSMKLWRQDKGAAACAAAFLRSVREGTAAPIPFEELMEVARLTLRTAAG